MGHYSPNIVALVTSTLFIVLLKSNDCYAQFSSSTTFRPAPDVTASERQFRVVYEWKTVDFAYRTEQQRLNAMYKGDYIPQNNIISDVKPYANRLYISVPRMLPGVPATLGWVISPGNNGRTDPEIEPFPSWDMNYRGNCSALQFVQGIAIDAAGILWAIDSGRTETLVPGRAEFSCPPKLVLFDLRRNGTIVQKYEFPNDVVARGTNYLNKIVVDDSFGGFAYITDNSGADPGIVVYSLRLNRSWKVRENNSMRAAQNAVKFSVNGTNLDFSIHIDGIALGPYYNPNFPDGTSAGISSTPGSTYSTDNFERNVYYCPLSSFHLYSIPASLLRDPEFSRRATPRQVLESVTDHGVKAGQSDGMIMDNQGILYFSLLKDHAIAQWDSFKPFKLQNQHVIAKDDSFIQWTDGMGFDEEGYLYVIVNRLHNFVAGRLNPQEVNYRILRSKTGTLGYASTGSSFNNIPNDNGLFLHEGAFDSTNRLGLGNGISSTTPIYSSLGSYDGRYDGRYKNNSNSLFTKSQHTKYIYLITFILISLVKLF